jgi:hypothetical protein
MRTSTLQVLCMPPDDVVGERLLRPQKGMRRFDWTDDEVGASTDFHISASELFRLLRKTGFEVTDFRELFAPDDAVDHPYYKWVPAEWAKKWPAEEIWRARKR